MGISSALFTLCMLGNFSCFLCRLLTFFQSQLFQKILSGTLSGCQTVWTQIRTDILSVSSDGPDLGPNCLQRLSADDKVVSSKEIAQGMSIHHRQLKFGLKIL